MTRRYENRVFSSIWNELDVRIFETTWRTSYRNAITTANILRWRQHFRSFSRYESLFPVKSFFSLLWAFFFVFLSRQKTATLRSLYARKHAVFVHVLKKNTLNFKIFNFSKVLGVELPQSSALNLQQFFFQSVGIAYWYPKFQLNWSIRFRCINARFLESHKTRTYVWTVFLNHFSERLRQF